MSRATRHGRPSRALAPLALATLLAGLVPAGSAAAAPAAIPVTGDSATTFVPIGGNYTRPSLEGFYRVVMQHASPPTVDVLVVPAAYGHLPSRWHNVLLAEGRTSQIQADCNQVLPSFPQFSSCRTTLVRTFDHADAMRGTNRRRFEDPQVDGMFLLGGSQTIAMHILAGSPVEQGMADAFSRGAVLGGTSAGNAVESKNMISGFRAGSGQDNELQRTAVDIWWGDDPNHQRGLSFGSTNVITDQHFYARGRFGRLVNAVAQSDNHFHGAGQIGLGVDESTGAILNNDTTISRTFGASSAAVIDFQAGGATHTWEAPNATLSARNVVVHLIAPSDAVSYNVAVRQPMVNGSPVPFTPPGPWAPGLLEAPGPGALILGGDVSGDFTGAAARAFVQGAAATGRRRLVLGMAGYPTTRDAENEAAQYRMGLRTAGWTGSFDTRIYGEDPFPTSAVDGAAGVLLVGGDQARIDKPLSDPAFGSFVRYAVANAPVTMTDRAMTPAMGQWYVANGDPPKSGPGSQAVKDFTSGYNVIRPGLDILQGAAFEPRLTVDYRWGRLFSLTRAHPGTIAFGICQLTAVVVDGSSATAVGERSVVSVDGRTATFRNSDNASYTALNEVLDAFAPGDTVSGG
jgi:cyanophycinase